MKKSVKILLKKDVRDFGRAGEIKTSAAGFARNFLLPKGLGLIATSQIIAAHEAKIKHEQETQAQALANAKTAAEKYSGKTVTLRVKAGEKGKLFGSVTRDDIAEALNNQHSLKLNSKAVLLDQPLKALGKHQVP